MVAAKVYRTAGDEFLLVAGKTFAEDLTPDDISRHQRALRKRGLEDRTIANRHRSVLAFLRYLKLDTKTLAPYMPRYEQRLPEVYGDEELRTFFDAITGDPLKVVYEILLMTGLRERGRSISPGPASISTGESCGFGRIRSMDSK